MEVTRTGAWRLTIHLADGIYGQIVCSKIPVIHFPFGTGIKNFFKCLVTKQSLSKTIKRNNKEINDFSRESGKNSYLACQPL